MEACPLTSSLWLIQLQMSAADGFRFSTIKRCLGSSPPDFSVDLPASLLPEAAFCASTWGCDARSSPELISFLLKSEVFFFDISSIGWHKRKNYKYKKDSALSRQPSICLALFCRLSPATTFPALWRPRTSAYGRTCCPILDIRAISPGTTPASSRRRATAAGTEAWPRVTKPPSTPPTPEHPPSPPTHPKPALKSTAAFLMLSHPHRF